MSENDGNNEQVVVKNNEIAAEEKTSATPSNQVLLLAAMGVNPELQKRSYEAMNALEDPSVDSLKAIFMAQKLLEEQVMADPKNAERFGTTEERKINQISTAIIHEGVELQRLTDFKWWKHYKGFDRDAAKEELIDIWHFVVQASLALGMTAEEVRQTYKDKNAVNFRRMASGY